MLSCSFRIFLSLKNPEAFAGLGFWRPVSFGSALDQDGKQIAYIASVAEGAAQAAMNFFPNVTATVSDLKFAVGKPIKTINGVDAFEYVYVSKMEKKV
jgi:hypothetical protein